MIAKPPKHVRAQTAIELAVFGAILIFVVGVIIRQALSASHLQNQSFRAMRQAMTMSYRYSAGLIGSTPGPGSASRQPASILFIEDRLTADSAKYGGIDRTPQVASASATYSRNLFMPVDAGEDYNLPVYDVFINGKHFPFTTARFRKVDLAVSCRNANPCPAQCRGPGFCSSSSVQWYPATNVVTGPCMNANPCPPACGGNCSNTSTQLYTVNLPMEWEDNCIERQTTTTTTVRCVDNCNLSICNQPGDCVPPSAKTWEQTVTDRETIGCAKLYDVAYNHPGFPEWCDGEPSGRPCPASNLTPDERFDLNRDGSLAFPPDVLAGQRKDFSWQWFLALGFDGTYDKVLLPRLVFSLGGPSVTTRYMNTLLRADSIVLENSDCQKNCKSPKHTVIDWDHDLRRERIMVDTKEVDPLTGVIKSFIVMDQQDGDIDFTKGDSDPGPKPGLTKNIAMYSRVRDGTYLLLEEGRLYNPSDGQFIRSTQRKDHIDIIERAIQLSNDTNRFCDSRGDPTHPGSPTTEPPYSEWERAGWSTNPDRPLPNPVEVCVTTPGGCFTAENIQKTCMNEPLRVIYVRSRVMDNRGRKWITPTSSDDYVDFVVPGTP